MLNAISAIAATQNTVLQLAVFIIIIIILPSVV